MATVTGFTAERMLAIENKTVVDGEVQGDNLILLTRDGTPIDAGNVRGPAGGPGPAGVIGSVNDQAVSAVYAPRFFATKAALDAGWANPPTGAMAITIAEEGLWERIAGSWILTNIVRVFANYSELNTRWSNPPRGSVAMTLDTDTVWYKFSGSGAWIPFGGTRVFDDATLMTNLWPSPPNGARALTLDTQSEWVRFAGIWQLSPSVRSFASIAERDARWANAPNGVMCTTPGYTFQRVGGLWKAKGPLFAASARNDFVPPNGPIYDFRLTIPTQEIASVVNVTAVMYAGYAGNLNCQGSIYTNAATAGDNVALMAETPLKAVAPGTWGKLGSVSLCYPLSALGGNDTFLRMYWTGSTAYCYISYYWSVVVNPT